MTVPPLEICSETSAPRREPQLELIVQREADRRPWQIYEGVLRQAGLRPTRPRLILGWILFSKGDRHITAETLHAEAIKAKVPISLATVYNTLNQFTEVGLLRQISVVGSKAFFDTNPSDHHHFFIQGEDDALFDIPSAETLLERVPQAPEGFEIDRVDVVVRLRRKEG